MWGANQNTQYPSGFYAAQPSAQAPPVMYQYNNSYQQPTQNSSLMNSNQPMISTIPPVPSQWKCVPCDLVLESEQALERHTASHVTCNECDFRAAPKVVKAHYQARHGKFAGSGFKSVTVAIPGCQVQRFRICVGNRPEDIAEWIAERKRRFPRQKQAIKEPEKEEKGLSTLLAGYGSSDEETAASNQQQQETKLEQKQPTTIQEVTPSESTKQAVRKRPCRYFVRDGTCRKGENCTFLHELSSSPLEAPRNTPAKRLKRAPTLLELLLQNDKKRENALTIQLLDYIVETDFLSSSGGQ